MSVISVHDTAGYLHFDEKECREAGQARAERYRSATPFPHICLDEFIDPEFLRNLMPGFPGHEGKGHFDRNQERLKYQYVPGEVRNARLRNLLVELNSPAFLTFLIEMTGIPSLIPDPYFIGGGLHETKPGGHLGLHADFNIHGAMKLERRINLIIYLNDDWHDEYGGHLELWDQKMKACRVRVLPVMARAVIFNTSLNSFHGHPEPLTCPPDRSRRSIATYYYTALDDGVRSVPARTTIFKPRPESEDKPDHFIAYDHFIQDWVPPKLQRIARRLNPFKP